MGAYDSTASMRVFVCSFSESVHNVTLDAPGHGVEEPIPGRCPGFGHVRRALIGFRQALSLAAIDRLPEDPPVAVAIRLKGDPLAVGGPNGKAVVPPERQAPNGRATAGLVHMDVGFLTIIGAEREALPLGRDPDMLIGTRR